MQMIEYSQLKLTTTCTLIHEIYLPPPPLNIFLMNNMNLNIAIIYVSRQACDVR